VTDADVPFRLHACPPALGGAALTGEFGLSRLRVEAR